MKTSDQFINPLNPGVRAIRAALGKTAQSVQFLNERLAKKAALPGIGTERARFQSEVTRIMEESHCDYTVAFNRASKKSVLFANSADMDTLKAALSGNSGVPPLTPALASLFRLPPDVTPLEWARAWEGNDSTISPINYAKIFSSLNDQIQSQKGCNIDDAIQPTKLRFPDLWFAVQEQAALSF